MANQVREYLADTSSFKIINEETSVGNSKDASSCIYHCYTDVPEKKLEAKVVGVGGSDHLGLVIKKLPNSHCQDHKHPQILQEFWHNVLPD